MAALVKASFFFLVGERLELRKLVERQCSLPLTLTLSPVYRGEGRRRGWMGWDATGLLAIVQLFEHKRFEHSAFERCEPRPADKQIANRSW